MNALATLVIEASAEAARQVREDPTRRLRTVTRVRPYVNGNAWANHWDVEVAYTPLEPGLGL